MKNILITGAGRSSSALIDNLLEYAENHDIQLTVGDFSADSALSKTRNHPKSRAIQFDVNNADLRESEVSRAHIVISLLPPHLHLLLAQECVKQGKHFITASYMTPEMENLNNESVKRGILLLNECGLDPGIDHMSAMEVFHKLKREGKELLSFKSYTGGLVAPESNNNPWGYKFSWNPRNVILAGQGTARYIRDGAYKYIPYTRLFTDIETVEVDGLGKFDGYANRDSLSYRHLYNIDNIPTLLRGTLRQTGFCRAWDVFVKLGLTDDSYIIEKSDELTYAEIIWALLPSSVKGKNLTEAVAGFCQLPIDGEAMTKVLWTGLLEEEKTGLEKATPAMILQQILERKWVLEPGDKDMIVMQHQFDYEWNDVRETLYSSLIVKGDGEQQTAMAKTVGLPLAIVAKLLIEDKLNITGVHIPVAEQIYTPVLKELKKLNINFSEKTVQK